MSSKFSNEKTVKLTYLAMLTALVIVLQMLGSIVKFGMFSCTLVLMPIVLGAAICGPLAGGWLGLVFAVMVFVTGDANSFLVINPLGTIVTVAVKGIGAGLAAGTLFTLLKKTNLTVATIVSAVSAPIVNTGIFLVGCAVFFYDTVAECGAAIGFESGVSYMFLGLAGGNFVLELAINVVLCPVIIRLLTYINKRAFNITA